ncbi:hypothetical protein [Bradyrhizobium sp. 76]|uniref:hypothetical protein n=1 Tax=Bradyrhizobium sp. 76 TaxID=2782680 RepID=UPI001FF87E53|nr:hypothetical protein [Bradyrhizobium sp. 76]MCK1409298.1 hypothetical protein [Bradyrhizobium sp. 76]
MDERTQRVIDDARKLYEPIVIGKGSRIVRGNALWENFEKAVEACNADSMAGDSKLFENINELAVAKILADDKGLKGSIEYEPSLLPSGRKIDFVADRGRDNAYIEVKSVRPNIADTEDAWKLYEKRRKLHPQQAQFIAHKDWMGGSVYGNTFSSRSKFLEYGLDFEERLAEAKNVRDGPGLLIVCGNGMSWHRSNLEDFADYYHAGKHRQDDPFALMEAHHIEDSKLNLLRNIDAFGSLKRHWDMAQNHEFVWPVRGPSFGGVIK